MVSATAGTSARRTIFSKPRYLMLGSLTLMNLPSKDTPAHTGQSLSYQAQAVGVALLIYPSKTPIQMRDSTINVKN